MRDDVSYADDLAPGNIGKPRLCFKRNALGGFTDHFQRPQHCVLSFAVLRKSLSVHTGDEGLNHAYPVNTDTHYI